ncbi:hypothetical protein [Streptomyces sp. NPDC056491]
MRQEGGARPEDPRADGALALPVFAWEVTPAVRLLAKGFDGDAG